MKQINPADVVEGNKLIADFDGLKPRWVEYPNPQLSRWEVDRNNYWQPMQYQSSWDWSIPVWGKVVLLLRPIVMAHDEIKHPDIDRFFALKRKYYNEIENNRPEVAQLVLTGAIEWYNKLKQ